MNDKKIVVPDGMMKAVQVSLADHWKTRDVLSGSTVDVVLEAALLWLSEHPIEPTGDQAMILRDLAIEVSKKYGMTTPTGASESAAAIQWQRIMFKGVEPGTHEAIKDLLWSSHPRITQLDWSLARYDAAHDSDVAEAYRRGQQSKDKA